jgi:TPR repeat protein
MTSLIAFALLLLAPHARAADDTARFYGTWKAYVVVNGQTLTLISVHDASGYHNSVRQPNGGDTPAGDGTFSAANGKYKTNAGYPNDGGLYHFVGNDTVVCTNLAGQVVTWKRITSEAEQPRSTKAGIDANVAAHEATGYVPPSTRPGTERLNPGGPPPGAQPDPAPATAQVLDPSLSPEVNAALVAMNRKDYNTAWREFTAAAQKGDSDGQFGLGAMLFNHVNPAGTGYYAQCEKWLLMSANQGNPRGMEYLGRYYYASGVSIAGGINPGINNAPIPPALQAQAEVQFKKARQWFEGSSEKGDLYSAANLAIMLDAGVGGPRDPQRAAQLRAQVKTSPDKNLVKKGTSDPGNLATTAAWQSGHYADAIQAAQQAAAKGDANAEALLGKAYYEGVGVTRNYVTALVWLNKSVAQGNADAMFILGLMYEHARGVNQNIPKAMDLFDRAAAKGQRYADMEAAGMRLQGESDKVAAAARRNGSVEGTACGVAGGVSVGPECVKSGETIDPFNAEQAAEPQ